MMTPMRTTLLIAAALLTAFVAGCSGGFASGDTVHSEHVSRATFHGTWPMTVEGGTLACDTSKGGSSVTFSPDGSTDVYAVNGTAMSWASSQGWKDVHDIWAVDPTGMEPRINSSDFDAEGLRLCGNEDSK
jgi:hypothetical protein